MFGSDFKIPLKYIAFTHQHSDFKKDHFVYLISKHKVVCRHLENIISKMTQKWKNLSFCTRRTSFCRKWTTRFVPIIIKLYPCDEQT